MVSTHCVRYVSAEQAAEEAFKALTAREGLVQPYIPGSLVSVGGQLGGRARLREAPGLGPNLADSRGGRRVREDDLVGCRARSGDRLPAAGDLMGWLLLNIVHPWPGRRALLTRSQPACLRLACARGSRRAERAGDPGRSAARTATGAPHRDNGGQRSWRFWLSLATMPVFFGSGDSRMGRTGRHRRGLDDTRSLREELYRAPSHLSRAERSRIRRTTSKQV